ncbi:YhjD/YihY/BrkB family envelope integrity protein [Pseudonocardia sp. T1-2H]|uniref:YhjD/YihY/BrkB family envelope integrity protein n=1 Tax=Pseudonocardia sp. T1-2H TaxID=3128899 RepID=UPI0031019F06
MTGQDGGDPTRSPRRVLRELGRSFPVSDVALWAGGASFFALLGVVPITLIGLRVAAALIGPDAVAVGMETAIGGLPGGHGTPDALRTLTATALNLSWLQTIVVLFPASLYGEGLRRAFLQLSPRRSERLTGWRGRLGVLPVVALAPLLVLAVLASAPVAAPLYAAGGGSLLLGVLLAFHVVWIGVSMALVLVYRLVAAGRVGLRALLWGGFGTGSFLAGFLQGFLLFLAIPVEWSLPFGGLPVFGAVAALALWLYLVHVLVLVGYRLTLVLDGRSAARDRPAAA